MKNKRFLPVDEQEPMEEADDFSEEAFLGDEALDLDELELLNPSGNKKSDKEIHLYIAS
jgi:hypothetical protein